MTGFVVAAALLVIAALVLLLPPLLRREQFEDLDRDRQNVAIARERLGELERDRDEGRLTEAEFMQARGELEQALMVDLETTQEARPLAPATRGRWLAALVAVIVPLAAIGLYWDLGTPQAVRLAAATAGMQQSSAQNAPGAQGTPSVEEMVTRLAARLEQEPNNPQGWFMLGRSYMSLGRYPEAVQALERVRSLVGDEPSVLVTYADALAMSAGGRLAGKPQALILQALEQDPDHTTGLWLAGMSYAEQGEPGKAIGYWRRVEAKLQEQPEALAELRGLIAQAQEQLGEDAVEQPPLAQAPATDGAVALQVEVALAPDLSDQVSPEDTLFVFARAVQGPPMPLAVVRKQVRDLPLSVTLDDSMAMMPAARLSNFDQVSISARVSKSGNARAQSGDLSGEVTPVATSSSEVVRVVINQAVP